MKKHLAMPIGVCITGLGLDGYLPANGLDFNELIRSNLVWLPGDKGIFTVFWNQTPDTLLKNQL